MPTSIVAESDLTECIFRSAGFSAQRTFTSASAAYHCACGKEMDISRGEGLQQLDKMPEQIRTCKQIQIERCRSERDRVGQRQRNGVDSTPGIAYRQHLLSSVTHILVSGSQVAPLTQWSLKPAHVWLISRSESMNNQLAS